MSPEEIERLRSYTDKLVQVDPVDGEHMIVRIFMLQDEYQDFIYNVVSTNKEYRELPRVNQILRVLDALHRRRCILLSAGGRLMLHTFVALVEDKPGVLTRVASLFRRLNINIVSLTVGESERPRRLPHDHRLRGTRDS